MFQKSICIFLSVMLTAMTCGCKNNKNLMASSLQNIQKEEIKEIEISLILGKEYSEAQKIIEENFEITSFGDLDYMAMRDVDVGELASFVAVSLDSSNLVEKIYLQSDKYTIFGVKSSDLISKKREILQSNGFVEIEENRFKNNNSMDAVIVDINTLEYVKNYYSEDKLLKIEALKEFKYLLPNSTGHTYLGNGQILEYISDDILHLEKEYKNTTSYKQNEFIQKYHGNYIKINGKVSDVLSDGRVLVDSTDLFENLGVITCTISLIPEQRSLVEELNMYSEISVFAKGDFFNLDAPNLLEFHLPCFDGIITKIENKQYSLPLLKYLYTGISRPLDKNKRNTMVESYLKKLDGVWVYIDSYGSWHVLSFKDNKFNDFIYCGASWVHDGIVTDIIKVSENKIKLIITFQSGINDDDYDENTPSETLVREYEFESYDNFNKTLSLHTSESIFVYEYMYDTIEDLELYAIVG